MHQGGTHDRIRKLRKADLAATDGERTSQRKPLPVVVRVVNREPY